MKKKFSIFISLIFFLLIFFNIQTKSYSKEIQDTGCRAFKKELKLFNDLDYLPSNLGGRFGFNLKQHFDDKKNEWIYTKSKNGNFLVGKVDSIKLASKIKTGYEIISLNDVKFTLSDKQNNLINNDTNIKFGFYNTKKGNFSLNLLPADELINYVQMGIKELSINDINIKKGVNEVYINYLLTNTYDLDSPSNKKLLDVIDGTILKEIENGKWTYYVCNYSEEEFKELKLADPGSEINFINLSKKDKNLIEIKFKITPYSKKIGNNVNLLSIEKSVEGVYFVKNKFNLLSFPFDKQKISLSLVDNFYLLDDRQVASTDLTYMSLNNFVEKNDISGWNIISYSFDDIQYQNAFFSKGDYADGTKLEIIIERKHGYYLYKLLLPIILILMVCWSSVWITPKEIESRLTITIVCLLSLIAYNFVIDSELPKLEYLTVMDWIILVSYVYATIPNFLSIYSFNIYEKNNPKWVKVNSYSKRYGPSSYILIVFLIILVSVNKNPDNASNLVSWMAGR
jgi:hypothetical protein